MEQMRVTDKNKSVAEEWVKLIEGCSDEDVRLIDVVIQTAAQLRAIDKAKGG